MTRGRRQRGAEGRSCVWTCPYCGASRAKTVQEDSAPRRVRQALRMHVFNADGSEHGPRRSYPDEFDEETVEESVTLTGD